jgi:NADH-quinone oxidoreductase subunit I
MSLEQFKDRNTSYVFMDLEKTPTTVGGRFKRFLKRTFALELFVGLKVVIKEFFKMDFHTLKYPLEKFTMPPRYRALHKLLRLLESGNNRCIDCGLCEKICIANCIRIDGKLDENGRKEVLDYTINLGRCIYCGYCAEVCPELAIVHGKEYELGSEQRAHYGDMNDFLTPLDQFKAGKQKEFAGFGSISDNADQKIKQTPLSLPTKEEPKEEQNV